MNLSEGRAAFLRAYDNDKARKARNKARSNLNMYKGDQWSTADKSKLKREGRVPIVINQILRQVNATCGLQQQNRTDFQCYPIDEFGDNKVADVLNKILKNIQDLNEFEFTESDVFFDGMVIDSGYYLAKPNFETDIEGTIEIERIKPERRFGDPDSEKYDKSDSEFEGYFEWLTPKKLKGLYPNAKDVKFPDTGYGDPDTPVTDNIDEDGVVENDEDYRMPEDRESGSALFFQPDVKKVRVIHLWHVEYEKKYFLIDNTTGDAKPIDAREVQALRGHINILKANGLADLKIVDRQMPVTKYIAFTYDQVLTHDDVYQYCIPGDYPLIGYFAWFRDGDKLAFIDPLKDPQMERNKRRVQALHVMNSSGFVYAESAVLNTNELREFGQRPDVHIVLQDGAIIGQDFQKYEPTAIADVAAYEQMAEHDIMEIGVNPDILGMQSGKSQESGILVEIRQKAGLIGLEGFFGNFKRTKRLLLRQVIHLVQTMWTAKKAIRLIGADEEFVEINMPQMAMDEREIPLVDPATGQAIMTVLNDVTVGRYDVKIAESPTTMTRKHKTFAEAIELGKLIAQAAGYMPVKSMIQLSDFPNKEEMVEEVRAGEEARQEMDRLKFSAQAKPKEGAK